MTARRPLKRFVPELPLHWRVFAATSISITVLFAIAGWGLQQYALSVTDQSVKAELRASTRSYEAIWKARTEVLSATTALMAAMSDVRAAFMTRDPETIRDSAQDLWSRVSSDSAVFKVFDAEGQFISSLGETSANLSTIDIPWARVRKGFPQQQAGYVRDGSKLLYVILTPVYVDSTAGPVLLNVLCAGFAIDDRLTSELKALAPGSDFAFIGGETVFASTFGHGNEGAQINEVVLPQAGGSKRTHDDDYVVAREPLKDITGKPIAELCVIHSYSNVRASLSELRRDLGFTWLLTIIVALLISLFFTRHLLEPLRLLDFAASQIAARNYQHRVPISGSDEFARLASTFNHMCDSIEQARSELIRQQQMETIGRLGTSLVHDLRNPLAAVYGGAEMLVDGQLPPEQTRRVADTIYRASRRIQ
ncbi:MAG: HAMP domain-containing protein, partial [Acidobacteriaceae bacterium]|nr:HAMP domain-containing protein [Acidobacteriaceae bacterium]